MKRTLLLGIAIFLGMNFAKSQVQRQDIVFPTQSVHSIDGIAWASMMGNNLITGSSFWVYINPNLEAIVAKRSSNGTVTTKVLMQNVQNNDNHAEFSLGVDNEGYIHVIGGQHNSSPKYYVSTNPDDISSFEFKGNDLLTGGIEGTQITYQSFVRSNKGTLFVSYRSNVVEDFVTGARSIALARYDTKTKKWTMIGGKNYQVTNSSCKTITGAQAGITAFVWNNSGVGDMRPATGKCFSQAHYQGYQLKIKFDQNNRMHVTYNMADSINMAAGQDVSKYMTHLFYSYSPDEGNTWFKANGNQLTTFPITKATGDLVYKSIPPGYVYPATTSTPTMPNSSNMILDKDGLPIVITSDNIANSTLMFKWSGTQWVNQTSLTNRSERFYTDLSKKIIYNFGSSQQFQMSFDNMATFTNNVIMVNPATWFVLVDDYYLTKTRNVMYYARNETLGNATIMNMVVSSPDASAPAAPSGLSSSEIAQNRITLNWTPSPELDVSRYEVYRNGNLMGSTGNSYYTITGLNPSTSYTFTVKAIDGSGNFSPASSDLVRSTTGMDTQLPVIPSGFTATEVTGASFKLNWNAATDNVGVVSYEIYKDGVWLASTTYNSYHVKALSGSTTYGMSVRAKDAAGNLSNAIVLNVKTYGSGLIIYEPYNYTLGTTANYPDEGINGGAGLPATNAGGNPTGTGTGLRGLYAAEASVVAGSTYMNLATSGGAHNIINATWGSTLYPYRYMTIDPFLSNRVAANGNFGVDGQSLYLSFIAKTSSSTAGAFCLVLGGSRNVYIENTATGWTLNDNKAVVAPTSATLELNTATLLVVKVDFKAGAADVVSLYKNPPIDGTLGSPVASLTVGADFTIGNFNTRPNVANAMTIDEFRMGLSYADVTPSAAVVSTVDTQAPTVPASLSSASITQTSFTLNWAASTDNVGVTGYEVFRDGASVGNTASTSYTISGLNASTTYSITVKSKDAAGNISAASSSLSVTTSGTNITYPIITARGEYLPNESKNKAFDLDNNSKWLDFSATSFLQIQYQNASAFNQYIIVSGNDSPERDPVNWTIQGSNNGTSWTTIDTRTNQSWASRNLARTFTFTNSTAYSYYKMDITSNTSGNIIQLSELTYSSTTSDTQAPTVPSSLSSSSITQTSFTLNWVASTDNVGVTGYEVFRDGTSVGNTASTSYTVNGLNASTTYSITVKSKDAAGNISAASSALSVTTSGTNITYPIITARGENLPNESKNKAFDLDNNSKWLDFSATSFLQIQYQNASAFNQYIIVSGNDSPERDPVNWTIQGSNNGTSWTTIDTRTNQSWASRNLARTFTFTNSTAYSYYKMNITSNTSGNIIQLSELTYSSTASRLMSIIQKGADTPIKNFDSIQIYPNPVINGLVNVSMPQENKGKEVSVSVSDQSGRIIFRDQFISNGISQSLNIGLLPAGIYIINLKGDLTKYTSKIIVK